MQKILKTTPKENNKLCPEDKPFHNWYRFVLSYPPHLVRQYINKFNLNQSHVVLDPFCGTGTTLIECKKHGIPSIGIEANRFAYYASYTKANWLTNANELLSHATNISEIAREKFESQGLFENEDLPLFKSSRYEHLELKKLPENSFKLLLKDSISPIPLHKAIILLDIIEEQHDEAFYNYEKLALSKALVFEISNLRFGPEVGVRKIKKSNAPVINAWLNCIREIVEDFKNGNKQKDVSSKVYLGDSRNLSSILKPNSVDAVITSPPYPNEKDYTRTTRLESVLLGLLTDKADLRAMKQ